MDSTRVRPVLDDICGGIIDLLNKRLRDRLQEIEILNIFTDVCEVSQEMYSAQG